jgi:hypothetical protein
MEEKRKEKQKRISFGPLLKVLQYKLRAEAGKCHYCGGTIPGFVSHCPKCGALR